MVIVRSILFNSIYSFNFSRSELVRLKLHLKCISNSILVIVYPKIKTIGLVPLNCVLDFFSGNPNNKITSSFSQKKIQLIKFTYKILVVFDFGIFVKVFDLCAEPRLKSKRCPARFVMLRRSRWTARADHTVKCHCLFSKFDVVKKLRLNTERYGKISYESGRILLNSTFGRK